MSARLYHDTDKKCLIWMALPFRDRGGLEGVKVSADRPSPLPPVAGVP